jgi:ABC-type antimicrobial peptide transport system permease subunit
MALGAGTSAILKRTGRQAAKLGVLGLVVGQAGSWIASRWTSRLVFGITAHDSIVLGAAALTALLIVVLAAAVPLWRAIRVKPIETLHES